MRDVCETRGDDPVGRAVACIRERYGDPLSLTDIAESARLSRFHFARLFKDTTGITPGRFLAAVRLHQAKRLLLSSSLNVADIAASVGYSSLGSFTTSFTAGVGVSPGRFRRLSRSGGGPGAPGPALPAPGPPGPGLAGPGLPGPWPGARDGSGAVAGTISLPDGHGNARVYVGAFPTPVVQHPAAAGIVVDVPSGRPSCYRLPDVPAGTWYVHAVAVADGVGPDPRARRTSLVGGHGAVAVGAGTVTSTAVRLRRDRPADPPVLLALPDLEPPRTPLAPAGCPASALPSVAATA
ncbi:helix-turn-helix domain-containing protein [Streptomyces uncialis]|uniref:helix-turn-helix domain-containing protein n=1 Tax=Streptomyces uncialis TaxID=1048205 RepID=UPI00224F98BD|nr:AraC family transcriptional regulator [Streptomyces uncialis]MCX4660486.1 AraC family transcriptional regulator [Streptomyces uncialis]